MKAIAIHRVINGGGLMTMLMLTEVTFFTTERTGILSCQPNTSTTETRKHKEQPKVTVKEAWPGKAAEGRREVTREHKE